MHRMTCNELRLDIVITTASPLSLQTADEHFVRSIHPQHGVPSIFIPAGTLKGALRRAAEHVFSSAGLDCCTSDQPCSERDSVKRARNSAEIYRALCSACKIFGSRVMRSHLTVTDAFPAYPVRATTSRDTTLGNVEMIQNETFTSTLALRNFERWQVGLLALIMSRINMADVQIGAYRSSGMGCISIRYACLTLLYPGINPDKRQIEGFKTRLHGVGQLLGGKNPYGYSYPDVSEYPDLPDPAVFETSAGYVASFITVNEDDPETSESAADLAHNLIDNVLTNQAMSWGSYVRASKTGQ